MRVTVFRFERRLGRWRGVVGEPAQRTVASGGREVTCFVGEDSGRRGAVEVARWWIFNRRRLNAWIIEFAGSTVLASRSVVSVDFCTRARRR